MLPAATQRLRKRSRISGAGTVLAGVTFTLETPVEVNRRKHREQRGGSLAKTKFPCASHLWGVSSAIPFSYNFWSLRFLCYLLLKQATHTLKQKETGLCVRSLRLFKPLDFDSYGTSR